MYSGSVMVIAYDFDSGRPRSNPEWGSFTKYIDGKASSIVDIIEYKSQFLSQMIDSSLFNRLLSYVPILGTSDFS